MSIKIFLKKIKLIAIVFIAAMVLTSAFFFWASSPPEMGGDFLLNYRDQIWKFSETPAQLNLVYVGYAKCPDVCPLSLSFAAQAFNKLTARELEKIRLIFISVDYEHDKAQEVADYASYYFKDFVGLTGTESQINFAVNQLGASYMLEKNPKSYLGYSIAHTDRIFFLNKKARLLDTISSPRSNEVILEKIKENL